MDSDEEPGENIALPVVVQIPLLTIDLASGSGGFVFAI